MNKLELQNQILDNLEEVKIFDMHTHLFPPEHKKYYLTGLDELLNYHYLIAELFVSTDIETKYFNSLSKQQKAAIVWTELFINRTPISEACKGILTILKDFSIEMEKKQYSEIRQELIDAQYNDETIFAKSNVSSVVMTNNPFDEDEWSLFDNQDWNRDKYRSSLRLDSLISEFDRCLSIVKKNHSSFSNSTAEIIKYLDQSKRKSHPVYAALSLDKASFKNFLKDNFWLHVLEWLKEINLPLSLMLGVKRQINKEFGDAGDGIGDIDLKDLSKLCINFPHNKFLVTCLSLNDQHELTVLARKHPNLRIFGFWWFMNQPSIIKQVLRMRIDLLGFNFIPQHSDARITDQLIYKWSHFKKSLAAVLLNYYEDLHEENYYISKQIIKRDINRLLNSNFKEFVSIN